jgi:hypothetical protein
MAEIGAFPQHDRAWQGVAAYLRQRFGTTARLLGPAELIDVLPVTYPYDVSRHVDLEALDAFVVHKGQLDRVGREICTLLVEKGIPLFGNEVFVVFTLGGQRREHTIGGRFFASFYDQARNPETFAPRLPKTHSEFSGPMTAILMTTFNRPERLRHSLETVAALKAPILVVDDGSDRRHDAAYAAVYEQFAVRALKIPGNRGLSNALTTGLSYWLADPNVHWISYLQDDVEVRADLLTVLAEVQDPTNYPLLTGRLDPLHTNHGQVQVNGHQVYLQHMCAGIHLHAHRDYWMKQLPIPTPYFQAPKSWPGVPQRGSDEDWWIAQWGPNSVVKQGKYVAALPGLVRTTTSAAEDSTWKNPGLKDPPLATPPLPSLARR